MVAQSGRERGNAVVPKCPRCGGRLFMDSMYIGGYLQRYWSCALGCSRQWGLDGKPMVRGAVAERVGADRKVLSRWVRRSVAV